MWRSESHGEENAYRLGFNRGENNRYDIAWLGLGADEALETVTGVTVYLPAGADVHATLFYTTRNADGTENDYAAAVADLNPTPAENGGQWLQIEAQDSVVGDSIRLAVE